MRKSPTIEPRKCEQCGQTYQPTGTAQRFCLSCKSERTIQSKRRYAKKMYPNRKPKTKSSEVCAICGAEFSAHVNGVPYCNTHYLRMHFNGSPDRKPRRSTTAFAANGSTVICTTSKGANFIVDACDFDRIKDFSWCINKLGYPVAHIKGRVIRLSRYLLSPPENMVVDHINGNPLDNRRSNLRICSRKQNSYNTKKKSKNSVVVGVQPLPNGKYRARITFNREEISLGRFDSVSEAVAARISAERALYGEYSPSLSRTTTTFASSE